MRRPTPNREDVYLHTHLREQPDLNWRNPEVRAALLDVLRFWLGRGADGVRIDVAHLLMKDPELRDNPPAPPGHHNPFELQHPEFFAQLHVNDRRHPDVHEVMAEIRAVLDEFGAVVIGELEAMEWDAWAQYYGEGLRGVQLPFAFKLIETPWNVDALRGVIRRGAGRPCCSTATSSASSTRTSHASASATRSG